MRSSPPAWRSMSSPRNLVAMAEHSMCQPGRPGPRAVSQNCSPGLAAFQRAKSRAASFSYSSTSTRAPSSMPSKSFLESLPYSGNAGDAEVPGAVLGLVGDVFGGELLDEGDHLGDAAGGVGDVLGVLDAEGVEVFEEGALELGGVLGDGDAGGGGVADDLVVDVGDVHDVLDGDALLADERGGGRRRGGRCGSCRCGRSRRRWGRSSTCAVRVRRLGRGSRFCRLRVLKSSMVATCALFLPQPARGAVQTALAWDP